MGTPILNPRGYNPYSQGPGFSQVIDRGPAFSQVIDRSRAGIASPRSQVIDRGPAFGQGYSFGRNVLNPSPTPDDFPPPPWNNNGDPWVDPDPPDNHGGGSTDGSPGPDGDPAPATDPFATWYKNTIQANPDKYDTNISEAQWRAWFPLWTGSGFKSSKVDMNGNPIPGTFDKPDDCPPGWAAFGANQCRPFGAAGMPGGGGGGGEGGGAGSGGGTLGDYPAINWPDLPVFIPPTGADESNDPGYQFRLDQGQKALSASAAARGVLNSGGTLLGAQAFGQNYASGEFDKVFQRAKDAYAPKLAEWQIKAQAAKEQAFAQYQRMWDQYTFGNLSAAQKAQLQLQMQQLQAQIDQMILNATAPA